MSITLSGTALTSSSYSIVENSGGKLLSDNQNVLASCPYTYGTASFQVDAAITITGVLPSGGTTAIDLKAVTKNAFGISSTVGFSGIKNLTIVNTATDSGRDISIRATGTGACTGFFNGGSGNLLIKPYSAFSYNDPYTGVRTNSSSKLISLFDVSGSGASYSVSILGSLT